MSDEKKPQVVCIVGPGVAATSALMARALRATAEMSLIIPPVNPEKGTLTVTIAKHRELNEEVYCDSAYSSPIDDLIPKP